MFEAILELQRKRQLNAMRNNMPDVSAIIANSQRVGPDIDVPTGYQGPPMMQMAAPMSESGENMFSGIAALGAQRMMNHLMKKKGPDTSGIGLTPEQMRADAPGILSSKGAMTAPGTQFGVGEAPSIIPASMKRRKPFPGFGESTMKF